jgi:DNA-binding PadR family transcriptional regulator
MAAKDLILGLIVDRPDYGYSLKRRLGDQLGSAGFAESIIYSALDSLTRDGLIEAVDRSEAGARKRRGGRNASYRATQKGIAHFDAWMADSSPLAPMREELRMKLALCKPRHVPRLIDIAWAQEQLCIDRLRALQCSEERIALDDCSTLPQALDSLLLDADAALLQASIEWLGRLRVTLRRFAVAPGGAGGGRRLRGV